MFRRTVLFLPLLAVALASGPAAAQEKKLTLRWHGQSFFQLETGSGQKIVFAAATEHLVTTVREFL